MYVPDTQTHLELAFLSSFHKMPTNTIAGTLLALSAPSNAEDILSFSDTTNELSPPSCAYNIPWCCAAWQQHTGLPYLPCLL
jgi:hypothetical protein